MVKSTWDISQTFVAFWEYMNFTPKIISPYCGLGAYKEWYVFHAIVNAMMMMGPYGHFPLNSSPYKVVFFLFDSTF